MKFIDLFAGIGGFRTGMEMNGHECLAFCEIDKYARQSYKAMYDTEGEEEIHDITKWTDEHIRKFKRRTGTIDCITGGFPCQSFSIAGKRGGFDDTRGTLFFEIMRIANIIRPRYLFLENVKGLLNHDGGATFETILNTLDEFGYDAEWQVLNSKDFGVPQNRERIFIVGHLRGSGGRTVFPVRGTDGKTNIPIKQVAHRKGFSTNSRTYSPDGITGTLDTAGGGGRELHVAIQPVETNRDKRGIMKYELKQKVIVRKHEINTDKLKTLLRSQKQSIGLTNKQIAESTSKPLTLVEHWFRKDNSFSIPDEDVWFELKGLLKITTSDFDAAITEFIEKDNEFEKSNRVYDSDGIAPTLTSTTADEKILVKPVLTPDRENKRQNGRRFKEDGEPMFTLTSQDRHGVMMTRHEVIKETDISHCLMARDYKGIGNQEMTAVKEGCRIRKVTPLECWRLQGFTDEQFYKAKNDGVSNSQLYKQAGNSVTVNVIDAIARKL